MAARYIYAGAWQAAEETLIPFGFGIDPWIQPEPGVSLRETPG